MTKIANFTLGAFVAAILMGPAAWADARQAVAHAGYKVVAVISTPAPLAHATATVRSAVLPKP